MFTTIRRYRITGSIVEALHRVQSGFVPQIQKVPGLLSYTIIAAGETWATVSIFHDHDAAQESNRLAALWAQQHLSDILEMPAQITSGEVLLHVTPDESVIVH